MMSGGREIPILISTPAIDGIGTTMTSTKSIDPKSNFFISLPPYLVFIWDMPFLAFTYVSAQSPFLLCISSSDDDNLNLTCEWVCDSGRLLDA